MTGVPEGYRRIYPLPDQEPVDFPYTRSVRASWITDELIAELLEDSP